MRHSRVDIEKSIFIPNKEKNKTKKNIKDYQNTNYTFHGMEDKIDDEGYPVVSEESEKVMARIISNSRSTKFLIRIATDGFFYNPLGIHNKTLFRKRATSPAIQFVEVNEKCFGLYRHFLSTGSERFLKEAQRQI